MKLILRYLICIIFLSACSVQKYLPPGESLYRGAHIKVKKDKETKASEKQLKKDLKQALSPTPNKYFLGQPYKVWWWYVLGTPKKEKGFKAFLLKRLGEAPVLSSRVNTKATAENMESYLLNSGYFFSQVSGDTSHKKYFVYANYQAYVNPQYHLSEIVWSGDSSKLLKTLGRISSRRSILKPGNPYNLNDIKAERDRLDLTLKNRGYYYFNPDYIMAYADSSIGGRKVKLYLSVKQSTPDSARNPYHINSITVYPNYSLTNEEGYAAKDTFMMYDSIRINDSINKFKPRLFATTITYRPGSLYSSRNQNATLNRFINLGAFKFVKNKFDRVSEDSSYKLDATYLLTPQKKKALQGNIDGFTKDNGFLGLQTSINWKNRNAMKGAEQLGLKTTAGIETAYGDSIAKKNNNYRLGIEASLKLPRYFIPFFHIDENHFYPPNTNIILGYEWYRKQLFYTKNFFKFQYEFTWKTNSRTQYNLGLFSLSYLNASHVTDTFYAEAAVRPSLLLNVYPEAILGTTFSVSKTIGQRFSKNKWYANLAVDLSGNVAGLISGAKHFREKVIFGAPFAQFVKTDFSLHYTRHLKNNWDWANRIQVGIGIPYNNSSVLPFSKLYTIGGSNSIRGFRARNVGPGTYRTTDQDKLFFQLIGGDYKLLLNTEIRIPLSSLFSTAVFVDAGNIWNKTGILFGDQAKLTKDFYKELAVATGLGLRIDASIFIIRVDLGMPLRKPYLPNGQRWVIDQIDFSNAAWRKENLVLNLGLGLPF